MTPSYERRWLDQMFPNQDAWTRTKLGLKEGEELPPPPTDEEKQAARAAHQAEVDVMVKQTVATYRPDLLNDADRKPGATPQTEEDKRVAEEAERYLRGIGA